MQRAYGCVMQTSAIKKIKNCRKVERCWDVFLKKLLLGSFLKESTTAIDNLRSLDV